MNDAVKKILTVLGKLVLSLAVLGFGYVAALFILIFGSMLNLSLILTYTVMLVIPSLFLPLIFLKKKDKFLKIWGICAAVLFVAVVGNLIFEAYEESITVDTSPNINIHEYLPFEESSKIVKLEDASLELTGELPIVDGAAAVFPVYSAFVHATYPDNTELYDGVFEYNNTTGGYKLLAEKQTDIFFGAYPSTEQIEAAENRGTTFEYTPIGSEAFVFFVHKDNPIDNLTTEQIRGIYSGEITNWKEVGGKNEKIAAFQRNEGSGSQSMLIRFMDGREIMDAPSELRNDFMSGIVEQVSDYKSTTASIGFSFRYYLEEIVQNPDIKMISIDGIAPTVENIQNGTYPITTPLYAVTYAENDNENVDKLINWILSEEGQQIIEKTGYVGIPD